MKNLKVVTAWVLMLSAALAFADPPTRVGRINFLSGTVSFASAEANDEWTVAILNRPVTTGDRLWADADGRAEMQIGSTAIRIPALTSLDVLNLDERGTQLRLAQGSVNVRLRALDAGDNFEISTPAGAVLLTQPGSYRVIVDTSGTAITIVVRRGQADVLTDGAPFTIGENQLATVAGGSPRIYTAPAVDEFDHWSAQRDSRLDNVAATRYVSREMTGYEELDRYGTWGSEPEFGTVWYPTAVAENWAPYRQGHWTWISPWGWTWIDDAPWGFAPAHYGRWIWVRNRWAWAPGMRDARPQYAPALVAFVGGTNWSVSVSSGPAVGWVPLGWREPYIPWYRSSPTYVRNVNRTQVSDIAIIDRYANARNSQNIRYMNRAVPSAMTVVTRQDFVSGQRADRSPVRMSARALADARVVHEAPVMRPDRSLGAARPGTRLPDAIAAREVLVATPPPTPASGDRDGTPGNNRGQGKQRDDRLRVRTVPAPQAGATPTIQQAAPEVRIAPDVPAPSKGEASRPQTVQPRERPQQQSESRQPVSDLQGQQAAERQRQIQQAQKEQSATRERQQRNQQEQQARQAQREEQLRDSQQRAQRQNEQAQRQIQQQSAQQEQQRVRQEQQQRTQQERAQREQQRSQQREAQQQMQQQRSREGRPQAAPPVQPAQAQPPQQSVVQPAQQPSAQSPRPPREPSKGGDREK